MNFDAAFYKFLLKRTSEYTDAAVSAGVGSIIGITFKDAVATVADLPATANAKNDARITNDTQHIYLWNETTWVDQGNFIDVNWSAILNKPSSAVADIDDAVSKKHTQGTDQGLDTGGLNAVTATQAKAGYTHSQVAHAPSDAVSLATVKADTDVADAISKKHAHANTSALNAVSGTNTGDETTQRIGTLINGATTKVAPDEDDQVGLMDSASGNILKKLSWANLRDTIITFLNYIYVITLGKSGGQTIIGGVAAADNLTLQGTSAIPTGTNVYGSMANIGFGNNNTVPATLDLGAGNEKVVTNYNFKFRVGYYGHPSPPGQNASVIYTLVMSGSTDNVNWTQLDSFSGRLVDYVEGTNWGGGFRALTRKINNAYVNPAFRYYKWAVSPLSNTLYNEGGSSYESLLAMTLYYDLTPTNKAVKLMVDANGAREAVTVLNNGNLGISQPTPTEKLDVVGNIKASGTLTGSNFSGTNTGDQVGDGVTITGAGTVGDPFVSSGGPGASINRVTFVNADLSAGIYTKTHNLGLATPYSVVVQVYDNTGAMVIPDAVVCSTNSFDIDLSSFGSIIGTWGFAYLA